MIIFFCRNRFFPEGKLIFRGHLGAASLEESAPCIISRVRLIKEPSEGEAFREGSRERTQGTGVRLS